MCVSICQCNRCMTRNMCSDCTYCFDNKDVDCSIDGIQNCSHFAEFGKDRILVHNKIINKENE